MKKSITISIVVTTYNGSSFIEEQLDSIKNQTMYIDEVLIFDDCSTDGTQDIIINYIKTNCLDNWFFEENIQNKGWRKNFIEGIWKATGDVIFLCDQDDIWRREKVERMTEIIEQHENIELLASAYNHVYADGRCIPYFNKVKSNLVRHKISDYFFSVPYPGCTYCVRRELAEECKKIWYETAPHDALLWRLAVIRQTAFACIDNLIDVRKHESTFTIEAKGNHNYENRKKWIEYGIKTVDVFYKYVNEENISDIEYLKSILEKNRKWLLLRKYMLECRNPWVAFRLIKYFKCYGRLKPFLADIYISIVGK